MPREETEKFKTAAELEPADELRGGKKGENQTKRKFEEKDQRVKGMRQMMTDGGFATGYTKKQKSGVSITAEEKNEAKVYIRADKTLKNDKKIRSVSQ
jgi:hypothetical protein